MLDKLEKPNLVIVDEWRERSEHFGQIRYDTFGHVALENNEIKEIETKVEPYDLSDMLDTLLNTSIFIRDSSLMFSVEAMLELVEMHYFTDTKNLFIKYKWKEV